MKKVLLVSLMLIVVIGLVGNAVAQDEDYKVLRALVSYDELPGMDPALAEDSSSIQVLLLTYIGLTVPDTETAAAEPGLAESWDIVENDDGTVTYTFHMLEEVPWVRYDAEAGEVVEAMVDGKVRYVTADDIVYGILRSLDPESAGTYSYMLVPYIVGAGEYNSGEGAREDVAVRAIDDYTFQLDAPSSFPWQLSVYGMWVARPQPQWVIEEFADFWQEPENYVQYGAYAVSEWVHGDSITLVANPFWPGTDYVPNPAIDEIQFFFREQSVSMSMFEAGQLDWLDTVPQADLDRIRADPELSQQLSITPSSCSYYYGMNHDLEPFDNLNFRLAFSYAVDRESIVDNVARGGQIPAQWFGLPILVGAPDLDNYPDLGIWYDPDKAREHLQMYMDEMGYTSVDEIPDITLAFNTSEGHAAIAQAIQQMWVEELGIEVQLTNQEWATYLQSYEEAQIWRLGWCMDYLDEHNFLYEVFHSTGRMKTHWSSDEFDALLEEAMYMGDDVAGRQALYAQAEEILVLEDAVIIPIYWYTTINMTAPNVERTFALDNAQNIYEWDIP